MLSGKRKDRWKDGTMWLKLVIELVIYVRLSTAVNVQYEPGMLDQFIKQSDKQCKDTCNNDIKCVWTKYYSRLTLCKIYGTNVSTVEWEPDMYIYQKPELLRENDKQAVLDCDANSITDVVSDTCQAKHCGAPPLHPDAELRGNMYGIGAKVRYNCIDGTNHVYSTCEASGEWSIVTLSCTCSIPTSDDVMTYTLKRYNVTHVLGEVSCAEGYKVLQSRQPFCQISSGLWTNVESRCIKDGWLNIFEFRAGSDNAIISSWETDEYTSSSHVYRDPLVDSWNTYTISQVRLDVFKNNAVVAYMLFNGVGTDKKSWFSHNKLLNNTWSDLSSTASVNAFSIYGLPELRRRFFASKTGFGNGGSVCSSKSWFVVTWNEDYDKDCNTRMPQEPSKRTVIMYANGTTAAKFKYMEFADSFNVSIYLN